MYHLARSGGGGEGFTSAVGAVRGATQMAPRRPRNSKAPAFLAASRCASIESAAGCAAADAMPNAADRARAKVTCRLIADSPTSQRTTRGPRCKRVEVTPLAVLAKGQAGLARGAVQMHRPATMLTTVLMFATARADNARFEGGASKPCVRRGKSNRTEMQPGGTKECGDPRCGRPPSS